MSGVRPPAECGTPGGYYRHRRTLKEPACAACKAAHAREERDRKRGMSDEEYQLARLRERLAKMRAKHAEREAPLIALIYRLDPPQAPPSGIIWQRDGMVLRSTRRSA